MQHHPNRDGRLSHSDGALSQRPCSRSVAARGFQFRAASPRQGCERYRALRRAHVWHRHGDGGPDPGVPARRPDGAARRDRRHGNPNLLFVRRQRESALRPRQGGGRRDRAGHRGRGHRRSRLFLSRSRRTRVEFRHPQSMEHPNCAPAIAGDRAAHGRFSRRASCSRPLAPSTVHKPARDVASGLALTILDKVSTSIEPALAEQTPDRATDDAALREMRDQLSKERLARVAADRQVSDIREQLVQERRAPRGCRACQECRRGSGPELQSCPVLRMPP